MAIVSETGDQVLQVGPLQILPEQHLVRVDGRVLMLSLCELRLLTELARRADLIMSREELFGLVWVREMRPGERSVDVYVRKLRVKLEAALPDWCFIHTHFGLGYRLTAEHKPERHNTSTTRSQPDNTLLPGRH